MLNALIIDDEINAIESLRWEINNFTKDVKILDTFTNPIEAISAINYLKPDLVFLDIEMPELDGFQLLKKLNYKKFDLIITTAYNQYAIKAFKENAIDYLLKPIDPDELVVAIEKAKKNKNNLNPSSENIEKIFENILNSSNTNTNKKIPIALSDKIVMVNKKDIMYCKSDGNYTHIFLKDKEKYFVSKNIKSITQLIDASEFIRVHKTYLVNINYIKEYIRGDGGELIMDDKTNIPVSRINKQKILKALHIS
jgi:two-component system LytT family response regulator